MRLRSLLLLAVSLAVAAPATAQGLAEAARKERERRAAQANAAKGKPVKVITDEDLKPADADKGASSGGTSGSSSSSGRGRTDPQASSSGSGGAGREDPQGQADQADWERRALERRQAITQAQDRVNNITAELERTRLDMDPNAGVLEANRMQRIEAQLAKLKNDLVSAQQELQQAKDALAALEEEARKAGIPPGWIREKP